MKPLLAFIPFVFLLLLINSCASENPTIPEEMWVMMHQTETARAWTPVPTPTFNPNITNMINWLNADLLSNGNSLGATMDAQYSVTNISLRNASNSSALIFQMKVDCICKNSANCCLPERTFVVIIETMKKNSFTTLAQVPWDVAQIMIVCFDQKTSSQIGAIAAPWHEIQNYLQGYISGYQLGVQVTRTLVP